METFQALTLVPMKDFTVIMCFAETHLRAFVANCLKTDLCFFSPGKFLHSPGKFLQKKSLLPGKFLSFPPLVRCAVCCVGVFYVHRQCYLQLMSCFAWQKLSIYVAVVSPVHKLEETTSAHTMLYCGSLCFLLVLRMSVRGCSF